MGKPKKSKHHGVRDPLIQREQREQRLIQDKKINNPPKEDQQISKRFKKFMELKQTFSKVTKQKNKLNGKKIGKIVTIDDDFCKAELIQKRKKNETDKQHLRRVDHLLVKKKQEAEYAKKFNVQIIRDDVTGEIKMKKDPLVKANQKKKKQSKEAEKEKPEEPSKEEDIPEFPLVKYQMNAKAKRKLEKEEPVMRDYVKFGEVVKEPPTFNLPQKPNTVKTKKKDFLFLSKLGK